MGEEIFYIYMQIVICILTNCWYVIFPREIWGYFHSKMFVNADRFQKGIIKW